MELVKFQFNKRLIQHWDCPPFFFKMIYKLYQKNVQNTAGETLFYINHFEKKYSQVNKAYKDLDGKEVYQARETRRRVNLIKKSYEMALEIFYKRLMDYEG